MVCAGIDSAGRLTAEGYLVGIAAEGRNVALNPTKRGLLVENAVVAPKMTFAVDRGMREKAEDAEAIVERDNNCRNA